MAAAKEGASLPTTEPTRATQVPDWEPAAQAHAGSNVKPSLPDTLRQKFDQACPPHRKCLGLTRRVFLLVLLAVILAIIALAVGLGVGLSKKSGSENLPLPDSSEAHTGDLTFYAPGLGACGETSTDDDDIVSLSWKIWDEVQTGTDPNQVVLCGKKIRARRFNEDVSAERSVDLTVVDRCTGCEPTDIDVSPGAFEKLAPVASGRVTVTWAWLDAAPTAK
ncbi:riboflavin aldehyde-forming enzyme [Diplodia corticola]|uniref:Riboflavin aldehyde-forming enzyme n=1 Tax=Diplodia corticola TaxID=236234 RepID=A0A1J9QRY3_9PEZI|nr:riboflavin aldehyde-forming enzyme [Diplodia corticola]OJD31710.1 riboflavin aldehyde-forming enzyme [Diplodia corticola]